MKPLLAIVVGLLTAPIVAVTWPISLYLFCKQQPSSRKTPTGKERQ